MRVRAHRVDGGGDGGGGLVGQQQARAAQGLGHRCGRIGDDGQAVVHRLQQRHAEPLVLAQAHEHVGVAVVGGQHPRRDRTGERDRLVQAQVRHEARQGALVTGDGDPAHQVQAGGGVVHAAVGGQRLDQVVLGLVGGDAPHEEHLEPTLRRGQAGGGDGVGHDRPQLDEHRRHRGGPVARFHQLGLVERRDREPDGGRGRERPQLTATCRHRGRGIE